MAAVGGVEAFWKDDQGGAGFGSFEYMRASAGEVGGLIGAWCTLNDWLLGREGEKRREPVDSCTRASLSGFLKRPAMFEPMLVRDHDTLPSARGVRRFQLRYSDPD